MSKEIKSTLKEIRNLLNNNEHREAMKKCQKVIKADKNNYTAILMLAAATKELDEFKAQTPAILQRAIELQPENKLAYQGLIAYYEKQSVNNEYSSELIRIYAKLFQYDNDYTKLPNLLHQIVKNLKDSNLKDVIEGLAQLREVLANDELKQVNETLMKIFAKFSKIERQYGELYESVLATLIHDDNSTNQLDYYKKYLKRLYAGQKWLLLFTTAVKMHEKYLRELCPLEWICRAYAERKLTSSEMNKRQIEYFYQSLLELDATSHLAFYAKAIHCWENDNFIDARDYLNQVVTLNPRQFDAWIELAEINAKFRCWSDVESASQRAFKLSTGRESRELREKIDLLIIESMARSEQRHKWDQAAEGCEELLGKNPTNRLRLLLARVRVMQEHPAANALLDELDLDVANHPETTILRALALRQRGCVEEAIDTLGSAPETTEACQMLGQLYWSVADYSLALMAFLKGIHADPNNWECLVYLGHYYRERVNDLEKARKCYAKALRINPNSDDAGAGLSTAYRLLKNTEANMQMLQRVTNEEGGGPKWAWLQLGLQQLDQGEIAEAIKSLRYVIRADPNDNHCWESLADAYWARGAHTSALKSYQRALDLSPGSFYPMIQLANIKLVLGRHVEAREAFLQVLSKEQHYIPALKGLAETCLGLCKENSAKQLLGRSRCDAQQAIDSLTDAIRLNSNLSCLWKLLGDACYRVAILPDKHSYLQVVPGLMKSDSAEERIEIRKHELFTLSARCYCRALSLSKDSSLLWHDLACCYLSQLHHDHTVNRKITADKCLEAAKQAVRLNSQSWVHWNILGVISMTEEIKNYALAQHCWVMAIDREANNAIAWTNLGTLYLHCDDFYKANEAFSRAQRADPDYQNSWIGQALIAELVANKEAMDLFRHSTGLGYHSQAALGYAHWVLMTILNPEARKDPLYPYFIVNMHAITVAADAITWYVERVPNCPFGRNAKGLLCERQKLLNTASGEFTEALKILDNSDDDDVDVDKADFVRANLARILVQMNEFHEAIEICQGIKNVSFNSHCQLALALFKAAKYEESYAAYEAALNWLAEDNSDKAHVLCAMASMAYMFQEVNDVKTLLFQCIQIQPPIVAGLLAAAALGLLHDDANLTTLVLNELEPYKDHPNYRHHVAILSAYLCLMHEDHDGAVRVISKAIVRRPDDVGLWVGLVRILIELNSSDFGKCAQKALYFGRKNWTTAVAGVACLSTLEQLMDDSRTGGKTGLRSVQKIIHSFPGNVESWVNLVIARLWSPADTTNHWLLSLIKILQNNPKVTKPMHDWLTLNRNKIDV